VTGNRFVHCAEDAITVFDGSADFIAGNTISVAAGAGIFSNSGIPGLVISQNKISHTHASGLDLNCDGSIVQGNLVTASLSDGFQLVGDGGFCVGNKALGCAGVGFDVFHDLNVLSGNTAKGSGLFDLRNQGIGNTIDGTNNFKTVGP